MNILTYVGVLKGKEHIIMLHIMLSWKINWPLMVTLLLRTTIYCIACNIWLVSFMICFITKVMPMDRIPLLCYEMKQACSISYTGSISSKYNL